MRCIMAWHGMEYESEHEHWDYYHNEVGPGFIRLFGVLRIGCLVLDVGV